MMLRRALLVSLVFSCFPVLATAQEVELEVQVPDEQWVWEDGFFRPDGTLVEGFYRQQSREGFEWVPGHLEGEVWVDPQWRWVGAPRQGYVLVTGHVGDDHYWVPEVWRQTQFANHDWVEGHLENGVWVAGFWRPRAGGRAGFVWEPGRWTPSGEWVEGHWREQNRAGYVWAPGRFRFGVWVPGTWRPVEQRVGAVWVGGHWGPNGWVEGQWRELRRPGHHWVAAHWNGGAWVDGTWVAGVEPRRRFVIRPVAQMIRARRTHVRRIRIGAAVEAHGHAVEHRGQAIERRGERVEIRGEIRGNARMQNRGERIQQRGEHVQQRGQGQQRRGVRIQHGHH